MYYEIDLRLILYIVYCNKMHNIRLMYNEEESIRCSYSHKIGLDLPNSIVIAYNVEDVFETLKRYSRALGSDISYFDEDNLELYVNFNAMENTHGLTDSCNSIRKNAWLNL